MSEKEKGKEKEKKEEKEEEIILHHFCHHHPLTLTQEGGRSYKQCYGCRRYIFSEETAYTCREGCSYPILHEECAEMPQEITHSMHRQHALVQKHTSQYPTKHRRLALLQKHTIQYPTCAVCEGPIGRLGYYCSSPDPCRFQVHVGCVRSTDIIHAAGERSCMKHPSHPHQLTLLWMPWPAGPLRCSACGTLQKGNFYVCIDCQYVIHESCADLSAVLAYHDHDAHPLTLAYHLPQEYITFDFPCKVCFKDLMPKNWLYHCSICRYIVHIKCATTPTSPPATSNIDAGDVITFPINNVAEELIEAFVRKVGGMVNMIPDEKEMLKLGKYNFHNLNHQLRLSSSPPSSRDQVPKKDCSDEDDDDDDEDDLYHEKVSKLVCDGCTEPIILSDPKKDKGCSSFYISCEESECKFYLHVACFQLPEQLTSSHIHKRDHILTLKTTTPKLDDTFCSSCWVFTNGLYYQCAKCYFRADIKCVALPATIKHVAHHPYHRLNLLTAETTDEDSYGQRRCGACGINTVYEVCYRCENCGVIFHSRCCLLPTQIINRIYDKHPLRLTFDATFNHPGEFYCDVCEQEMNPKFWMYHCRECDVSIHPDCFPSVSDSYRNVKFGGRYLYGHHYHPSTRTLRFQPLTNSRKPRCDVCSQRIAYGTRGFQCCSEECDFFMCFDGHYHSDELQAADT